MTLDISALRSLSVAQRLASAPQPLQQVVALATRYVDPQKVVLFGSRARGDARPRSDLDIGIEPRAERLWGRFVAEAEEQVRTLLKLDLVNLCGCQPELRAAVEREGVVLYERP